MGSGEKGHNEKTEIEDPSRRKFLKQFLPGGWIPEAIRSGGIGHLSKEARISLIKDTAFVSLAVGGRLALDRIGEENTEKSLKEKILSLTWQDVEDKEKLQVFTETLANAYLQLTNTSRLNKEDLLGKDKTNFYKGRESFLAAIKTVSPSFELSSSQWGYAHYETRRVFIDLDSLRKQSSTQTNKAGLALLDALWHEWGHLDIVERTSGELINNSSKAYLNSPNSKTSEPYSRYRGGAVYTQTYYGFLRFEEILNEAINVRRMIEQVGLGDIVSAGDYYKDGINFFPKLTSVIGISLNNLYQMHATSDFEGLAKRIGGKLPGNADPLIKGIVLFIGIHASDSKIIQQTGALDIIK
jgi:flagellin-like hook-associated protein FlgL